MCGLCGLLGITHWTEMSAHPDTFTGSRRRTIRSERLNRMAVVNRALAPFRITVADFQATAYVVSTATGKKEIVDDIQAVWGAVERLRGAPADPCDPAWLRAIGDIGT